MKSIPVLFVLLYIITQPLFAQIDQVSVGSGYSQQAYYSLSTGAVEVIENDAWDISFSALNGQDAGLFVNESAGFMGAPMQVFLAPTTDWSENIIDTDIFVDSVALHNPEENWSEGAFNTVADPASSFDYGWGTYNPMTHIIEGDKIFVIRNRQGNLFKMQVTDLLDGVYTIRWASLDGSNEKTQSIDKSNAVNGMIHFSFDTVSTVDMPNDYDLIFQRYTTPLDAGDGLEIQYTVTGVLLANGVEAVIADGVDPSTVRESDYSDNYTSLPTIIGHTWKSFDFASGWLIDEDRTHFVKTNDGEIYQLTFFDFEGSSTGTTTLERTLVGTVSSIDDINSDATLVVFPNPTSEYFMIGSDSQEEFKVTITNNSGQLMSAEVRYIDEPISLENYSPGIYNIAIQSTDFLTIKRLVIR